jgi:hypothetical protein
MINGITPMNTHVESMHPKLVACKSWPLLKNLLLLQITVDSLGRSSLGHMDVQSHHILVLETFVRSLIKHNISFLKT